MTHVVVLAHGHILDAVCPTPWNDVVIGNTATKRAGRITTALQTVGLFASLGCSVSLLIGTGANRDVLNEHDQIERRNKRRKAGMEYQTRVLTFGDYETFGLNEQAAQSWLLTASWDFESMSTDDEVSKAVTHCTEKSASNLVLISSPEHIFRCHQTALRRIGGTSIAVFAHAASTGFGTTGEDALETTILEGVHGAHDSDANLPKELQRHNLARAIFFGSDASNIDYRKRLLEVVRSR